VESPLMKRVPTGVGCIRPPGESLEALGPHPKAVGKEED
jgi:hypothetical protein